MVPVATEPNARFSHLFISVHHIIRKRRQDVIELRHEALFYSCCIEFLPSSPQKILITDRCFSYIVSGLSRLDDGIGLGRRRPRLMNKLPLYFPPLVICCIDRSRHLVIFSISQIVSFVTSRDTIAKEKRGMTQSRFFFSCRLVKVFFVIVFQLGRSSQLAEAGDNYSCAIAIFLTNCTA